MSTCLNAHQRNLFFVGFFLGACALGVGSTTARAQNPPSLAGTWRVQGGNAKKLILTQDGSKLQGRLEGDAWVDPVEGSVSAAGVVTLTQYSSREFNPQIPEDVWLQIMRTLGAPNRSGAIRSAIQLQYQADKDVLTGTRNVPNVTYSGTTHKVSRVFATPQAVQLTRAAALPDLEVIEFTSLDDRFSDTAIEKVWNIRAVIRNSGKEKVPQRFRVRLEVGHAKAGKREPQFTAISGPSPWIELPPLLPNISTVVLWTTKAPPPQAGGTYAARFAPPTQNIAMLEALRVVTDSENAVEESSESNNHKTLWLLGVAPCVRSAWVEIPSAEADTAKAADNYRQWRVQAANPAEAVLCYIKTEAQRRAKRGAGSVVGSNFLRALTAHFLKDYLANPTQDNATKAINQIGAHQGAPSVPIVVREGGLGASLWVPEGIRQQYPELPKWLYPATQFWVINATGFGVGSNIQHLRLLDVPFLIGGENLGMGGDEDVRGGGKNLSNVMHWATGVKYGNLPKDGLRTLFIGYELWHLEGWDTFSEDPINDLISEEQGRMLGVRLRNGGGASEGELLHALDEDFKEARAWVGTMLRERRTQLEAVILAPTPPKSNFWWGWGNRQPEYLPPWGREDKPGQSIRQMLADGKKVEEVIQTGLVERLVQIYTLIFEVDEWERRTQRFIQLTDVMRRTVRGDYDAQFQRVSKDNTAEWEWQP